jgi:hypothetical protein
MSHWLLDDVVWEERCEVQGNMLLKFRGWDILEGRKGMAIGNLLRHP